MTSRTFAHGLPKSELANTPTCSACGKPIGPGEPFVREDDGDGRSRARHLVPIYFDERARAARNLLADIGFCLVPDLPHGSPDAEWLAKAGDNEWTVLTQDARITERPDGRAAIVEHNVKCFILPTRAADNWQLVHDVLSMWEKIRLESAFPGPFIWKFNDPSNRVRWHQLYPEPKPFRPFDFAEVPVGHLLNLFADIVTQHDGGWFSHEFVHGLHENVRREIEARIANDRSIVWPADNSHATTLYSAPRDAAEHPSQIQLAVPEDTAPQNSLLEVLGSVEGEGNYVWLVPTRKLAASVETPDDADPGKIGPGAFAFPFGPQGFRRSGFGIPRTQDLEQEQSGRKIPGQERSGGPTERRAQPQHTGMTSSRIAKVKTWLERMGVELGRAIHLSSRMSRDDLDESSDLFWALAKYAENVQESVVQLDNANTNVYPALVELSKEKWKGLKGMRSRLAHAFWNINPEILWATVTEDFPKLRALLSTIVVLDDPVTEHEGGFSFRLTADQVFALPTAVPDAAPTPGGSIIVLAFLGDGQVRTVRVNNEGGRSFSVNPDFDSPVKVYAR